MPLRIALLLLGLCSIALSARAEEPVEEAQSPPRDGAASDSEGVEAPLGEPGLEARLNAIRRLRLSGALTEARELAERSLQEATARSIDAFELHLELARIHDRLGLHQNTRPVAAALAEIHAAEALADDAGPEREGSIALAKGEYYYRAEMSGREFPTALAQIERSIALLQAGGDSRELAEAVHRLGLIRLQRRELPEARELFDRSLEIDDAVGPRDYFHGEYHRHVAFVFWLSGDIPGALPHLRQSLEYRRRAGAIDASLFAAVSLGAALVETGAPEDAQEPLAEGLRIAREIDSPVGTARAADALGAMHTALGNPERAREAYELALDRALTVGIESIATRAREALEAQAEAN